MTRDTPKKWAQILTDPNPPPVEREFFAPVEKHRRRITSNRIPRPDQWRNINHREARRFIDPPITPSPCRAYPNNGSRGIGNRISLPNLSVHRSASSGFSVSRGLGRLSSSSSHTVSSPIHNSRGGGNRTPQTVGGVPADSNSTGAKVSAVAPKSSSSPIILTSDSSDDDDYLLTLTYPTGRCGGGRIHTRAGGTGTDTGGMKPVGGTGSGLTVSTVPRGSRLAESKDESCIFIGMDIDKKDNVGIKVPGGGSVRGGRDGAGKSFSRELGSFRAARKHSPNTDTYWHLPSARFLDPFITLTLEFWVKGGYVTDFNKPTRIICISVCARRFQRLLLNDHKVLINDRTGLDGTDVLWRRVGSEWVRVVWNESFAIANNDLIIMKTSNAVVDIHF